MKHTSSLIIDQSMLLPTNVIVITCRCYIEQDVRSTRSKSSHAMKTIDSITLNIRIARSLSTMCDIRYDASRLERTMNLDRCSFA
jgi:hypothetical protein